MERFVRVPARSPYGFLEKVRMQVWWMVRGTLFRCSFHKMNGWRCFLLRLFGARVGANTFIYSSANIWFPWNFSIGSNSGVGFDALIYNLDKVTIGDFSTVSQRCHINTGSHDYTRPDFPLITKPVNIGYGVFVGTDVYVGMGVSIGDCAVIGARSVVVKNMPESYLCVGHPCNPVRQINFSS